MITKSQKNSSALPDILLSPNYVQAWLGIDAKDLAGLVAKGTLKAQPSAPGCKPGFSADVVAKLAAARRRSAG
jgi:hypothetical protein